MTLRLRLVLATVALLTVGLALFGVVTYSLDATSEYNRLDSALRGEVASVERLLEYRAGIDTQQVPPGDALGPGSGDGGLSGSGGQGGGPHGGAPNPVPPGTYGELLASTGGVLSSLSLGDNQATPKLPSPIAVPAQGIRFSTVGSTSGSAQWRVAVTRSVDGSGRVTIVAVPTTDVTNGLHHLVFIETLGALLLLVALSGGSWLLLRQGLHPLERMAATARSINAGDLSQRVTESGPSEVGQLGLALNRMLEDIEAAFDERQRTELKLRQFLADASHELRTPLTSIQGFAELFRVSGDQAKVDLPTILRRIEEESARMKMLVEDLLLLARLDQTRQPDRGPVDLSVLAADACSDAVAHAPDRSVTLDAPDPVVVAGDEPHLRQAVANLVTNAVRHTPDGTPIEVSARLVGGEAVVEVRDHGGGLDEEALAHVFDRFWQADRARVGTGAGLGLAIVAAIADEHGGRAEAANADGGGALFRLRLPITMPARR